MVRLKADLRVENLARYLVDMMVASMELKSVFLTVYLMDLLMAVWTVE
jgi:hypothetical protein